MFQYDVQGVYKLADDLKGVQLFIYSIYENFMYYKTIAQHRRLSTCGHKVHTKVFRMCYK